MLSCPHFPVSRVISHVTFAAQLIGSESSVVSKSKDGRFEISTMFIRVAIVCSHNLFDQSNMAKSSSVSCHVPIVLAASVNVDFCLHTSFSRRSWWPVTVICHSSAQKTAPNGFHKSAWNNCL